ncbi:hypothetical protein PMZ80_010347 [Knufia obscura]|uniref:Cytochrome P450 n=2 Tax=Knufia TaxID=430999 RepID=A0AAN8EBX4_9EURO|nr:hypothetical protein PMZ80_010347 [Knufia obscura]KAK5951854.1 hypothetical protein OHC33_007146 [Knufia fluminis]
MIVSLLLWTAPLLLFIYLCNSYSLLPSRIPGPFLAKFTDFHRFFSVYRRSPQNEQNDLHKQYRGRSDLVRLGPNTVSVSGPGYIQQIYAIDKKLPKSDFYATFQNIVNGRRAASLVAVTDEQVHAKMKRLVANAYALSTLVEFEPLVDSTTHVFLDVLQERFASKKGQVVDLGEYLQFYAFDVMGELTMSRRLGFIEQGVDVNNIMKSINANFEWFSLIGQMPWLDNVLGKNPIYVKYFRKQVSSPILQFAQQLLQERLQQLDSGEKKEKENAINKPDFLARFLQAKNQVSGSDEEVAPMTDSLLLSLMFGNINAGADTIATTLRAVFYYLLTHPEAMATLKQELKTAQESGDITSPCPTWQETQSEHMTYTRCVVKEAIRLWPALSLVLERKVVDPAGLPLHSPDGEDKILLPRGTTVGINPYVLHRDPRVFDPVFAADPSTSNVESFDPARWLPSTSTLKNSRGNTDAQIKSMDHDILTFSAGKRSCLGKNIAMMEMLKVVPALVMKFPDMQLVDASRWKVKNVWVLAQTGLDVKLNP